MIQEKWSSEAFIEFDAPLAEQRQNIADLAFLDSEAVSPDDQFDAIYYYTSAFAGAGIERFEQEAPRERDGYIGFVRGLLEEERLARLTLYNARREAEGRPIVSVEGEANDPSDEGEPVEFNPDEDDLFTFLRSRTYDQLASEHVNLHIEWDDDVHNQRKAVTDSILKGELDPESRIFYLDGVNAAGDRHLRAAWEEASALDPSFPEQPNGKVDDQAVACIGLFEILQTSRLEAARRKQEYGDSLPAGADTTESGVPVPSSIVENWETEYAMHPDSSQSPLDLASRVSYNLLRTLVRGQLEREKQQFAA